MHDQVYLLQAFLLTNFLEANRSFEFLAKFFFVILLELFRTCALIQNRKVVIFPKTHLNVNPKKID